MSAEEFISITKDLIMSPKTEREGLNMNMLMIKIIMNSNNSRGELF